MFDCVYPCQCGYYGDSQKPCTCAPAMVTKYQEHISGPLLDRIDIHIEVTHRRFANPRSPISDIICNADMRVAEVRQFCQVDDQSQALMHSAMTQLNLSARAYHRILKLARTIADLSGSEQIQSVHLAEALQYRPKLMM